MDAHGDTPVDAVARVTTQTEIILADVARASLAEVERLCRKRIIDAIERQEISI